MFNLICVVIVALLGCVGIFVFPFFEAHVVGYILCGMSFLWFFASFVNNLSCYNDQIEKFEDIRKGLKRVALSIEKQGNLISEFKLYLADKYPELEKEIYRLITESKSDVHIILNYPELKSSETLLMLTKQINDLAEEVYKGKSDLEYEYAKVRFFNKNMWFYLRPSVPKDIEKLL
jgi:hypothetical protein